MFNALRVLCYSILILMLSVTTWASLDKNVLEGTIEVLKEPWAVATLADAYCGFLTFYAWVFYKETSWIARISWFLAIMILGNFAMSGYLLVLLMRLGPSARPEDLLLRKATA